METGYLYKLTKSIGNKDRLEGVNGSTRDAPRETRVSEFVQLTGKMKNRKSWDICHTCGSWRKWNVVVERRQQSIFSRGSAVDGSQSC
jgi:hypothetical protein